MIYKTLTILIGFTFTACASTPESKNMGEKSVENEAYVGAGEIALSYRPSAKAKENPSDKLPAKTISDKKAQNPKMVLAASESKSNKNSEEGALPIASEDESEIEIGKEFLVSAPLLNVRGGPSMSFPPLRVVKGGTKVKMLDREGVWVKIGNEEFVSIKHLKDI